MNYPKKIMSKFNSKTINTFFCNLYQKIVVINDTPQKIALGVGLGVFLGIMPGMGPIAALFLAHFFKVNKAAALSGSLLTNTWLSLVTFFISLKLGSFLLNVSRQKAYSNWLLFLKDFHWLNLFRLSMIKIIFPLILGYFGVALILGTLSYIVTLTILRINKLNNKHN